MQKFDDKVRAGSTVLTPQGDVLHNVAVNEKRTGVKEVIAKDRNFNYNAAHCRPVYIDEV